jgi:hypothetical protein
MSISTRRGTSYGFLRGSKRQGIGDYLLTFPPMTPRAPSPSHPLPRRDLSSRSTESKEITPKPHIESMCVSLSRRHQQICLLQYSSVQNPGAAHSFHAIPSLEPPTHERLALSSSPRTAINIYNCPDRTQPAIVRLLRRSASSSNDLRPVPGPFISQGRSRSSTSWPHPSRRNPSFQARPNVMKSTSSSASDNIVLYRKPTHIRQSPIKIW